MATLTTQALELRRRTTELSELGRGGHWQDAVASLLEMQAMELQPGIVTYNALLSALDKGSQSKQTLWLASTLPGLSLEVDVVTYCASITAAGRGRQWQQSLELFEDLSSRGLEANTFASNAAVSAAERGANWRLALSLLTIFCSHGPSPDRITFNSVIAALSRSGRWQSAIALMDEMKRSLLEPGRISYNSVLAACSAAGLELRDEDLGAWMCALHVLSQASVAGFAPDMAAMSCTLSACGRAGRWQPSFLLFDQMCERGQQPDVAACGALLDGFARGCWGWAIWLLGIMTRGSEVLPLQYQEPLHGVSLPDPDVAAYTATISACRGGLQWEWALQLLQEMQSRRVCITVAACNAVIAVCERSVRADIAIELLEGMSEFNMEPDIITYISVISACGRGQRWENALANLQRMEVVYTSPTGSAFNAAISACEKGCVWLPSLRVIEEMRRASCLPSLVSYSAAISASAAGGEWLQALRLLGDAVGRRLGTDEIAWNSCLRSCEPAGKWQWAKQLLADMPCEVGPAALAAAGRACENACEKASCPHPLVPLLQELEGSCCQLLHSGQRVESLTDVFAAEELLSAYSLRNLKTALEAVVFRQAFPRLQQLCYRLGGGPAAEKSQRHAESASRLREPLLERQFTLGASLTLGALLKLSLRRGRQTWASAARSSSRGVLQEPRHGEQSFAAPAAQDLPGWLAVRMHPEVCFRCRGHAIGYGGEVGGPLLPVFVQHDRSRHAERQALSSLLSLVVQGKLSHVV